MSIAGFVTLLFWLATATLAVGLARRGRLWTAGRRAEVNWSGLLAIPKRYFVDLHHIVARDPYIAYTHMATAGGAIAALILVALNYGLALYWPSLDLAISRRCARHVDRCRLRLVAPARALARLSRGAWDRLPYTLAAFAAGLALVVALPPAILSAGIAAIALILLLVGSAELALGIGLGGPMKHAVAGLLHLAFHPRPERFAGVRSTALKPLDLGERDFGVDKPADFRWNQLLGFDACVQCGKCEQACPAFAAGQPLNPKKLIQDLVAGLTGESDAAYAGSPYPGIAVGAHAGLPGPADRAQPDRG